MTIWDKGYYDVEKWSDGEVKFVLHGSKASGSYVLFQTKDRNWMIHLHGPSTRTDPLPTSIKPMLATAGAVTRGQHAVGLRDQVGRRAGDPLRGGRQGAGPEPQ